jgi:hypothetical protein
MGKRVLDTQLSHTDVSGKAFQPPSKSKRSKALKRVFRHLEDNGNPKLRGFYLSNKQIINLGNALEKMQGEKNGPDGLCFMIGEIDAGGTPYLTIEMIPFKRAKKPHIKFYKENGITGAFPEINLGQPFNNDFPELKIDGNGVVHEHEHNPDDTEPIPNHVSGQHTPPPFE